MSTTTRLAAAVRWVRSRRSHRSAAVGAAMLLSLATAAVSVAAGQATPAVKADTDSGLVWLTSTERGAVTAIDSATGRPVAEVAGEPSTSLVVSQTSSGSYLLDPTTRTLTNVHADDLSADKPLSIAKLLPGTRFRPSLILGDSDEQAVLVEEKAGSIALLRGSRLATPIPLGGRVSSSALDRSGVVWLAIGQLGTVVAVDGASISAPLRICSGGAADCTLAVAGGHALVVDAGTGTVSELRRPAGQAPTVTTRGRVQTGAHLLAAGNPDGLLAVLDTGSGSLQSLAPDGTVRGLDDAARTTSSQLRLVGERAVLSDGRTASAVDVRTGARTRLGPSSTALELVPTATGVVVNDRKGDRAVLVTATGERTLIKYDPQVAAAAVRPGTPVVTPDASAAVTRPTGVTPTAPPTASPTATASATATSSASVPVATAATMPSRPSSVATAAPTATPSTAATPSVDTTTEHTTTVTYTSSPTATSQPTQQPPASQPAPSTTTQTPAPPAAPGRPTLVQRVATSPLGLELSYQATGTLTSWQLRVFSLDKPSTPVLEQSVAAAQTSTTLELPSCGRYFAQVTAIGPGGRTDSAPGDPTLVCPEMSQVSGLTTQQSASGLAISWDPPAGVDGLSQSVTLTSATTAPSYEVGTAGSLTVPNVPANTRLTVTVTARDRWDRWVSTSADLFTVPASTGVCGTEVGSVVKLYWRWQTWAGCGGQGDFRVYTEASADLGITKELWIATNAAGNQRLVTRLNGQITGDFGGSAGFTLSGVAPLGYLPAGDLPGVTSSGIAAFTVSRDSISVWTYSSGAAPVPAAGSHESVAQQGPLVVGAT